MKTIKENSDPFKPLTLQERQASTYFFFSIVNSEAIKTSPVRSRYNVIDSYLRTVENPTYWQQVSDKF